MAKRKKVCFQRKLEMVKILQQNVSIGSGGVGDGSGCDESSICSW